MPWVGKTMDRKRTLRRMALENRVSSINLTEPLRELLLWLAAQEGPVISGKIPKQFRDGRLQTLESFDLAVWAPIGWRLTPAGVALAKAEASDG